MGRGVATGTAIALGELTVGDKIGEGGFGVVHTAALAGIEMPFAIKFLDPHPGNEDREAAKKRFFREANLLFQFRHQHIVPIYGVGEYEGKPYILMEKFSGMSLTEARTKFGQPDPMAVLPFIDFVADALAHAHERNVVHRDIKPSNLMTIKGDARVLDFGVAALLDPEGERFTRTSSAVAGDVFSAPELSEDPKLVDPRCDIYSLGASWFWLLTGTPPKGRNWESKLRATVKVPRTYEDVLLRCLEQPDRRYPTARELTADVRALRKGEAPAFNPHEVSDDQARLLGVIVAGSPTGAHSVSFYKIEQELAGRVSPLRASLALTGLMKRAFIAEDVEVDGYEYKVYRPTAAGQDWAERNLLRIEELERVVPPVVAPVVATDDDMPF